MDNLSPEDLTSNSQENEGVVTLSNDQQYFKDYYQLHREEKLAYQHRYRQSLKEIDPDYEKKRYARNKERDPDRWRKEYERQKELHPDLQHKIAQRQKDLHPHDHPEIRRRRTIKSKYKMSIFEWYALLEYQGYRCAICGEWLDIQHKGVRSVHTDHNHNTGVVRGLVHFQCNLAMSVVDDPVLLPLAMAYAQRDGVYTEFKNKSSFTGDRT